MNYWRNPPPALREREAARFPAWMTQIALSLPKLEVLRTEVRALGDDTWRVRFAVANSRLPAGLHQQARAGAQDGARRGLRDPPAAGPEPGQRQASASTARSSKAMRRRPRCRPSCPTREVTADRAVAEWVVRAPQGTRLALERARRSRRRGAHRGQPGLRLEANAQAAGERVARGDVGQRLVQGGDVDVGVLRQEVVVADRAVRSVICEHRRARLRVAVGDEDEAWCRSAPRCRSGRGSSACRGRHAVLTRPTWP